MWFGTLQADRQTMHNENGIRNAYAVFARKFFVNL